MRKLVATLALLALLAGAVTAYAATRNVKVGDDWFVKKGAPTSITVKQGTRLKFRWTGDSPHNVVRDSGPAFRGSPVKTSGTWTSQKLRRGTYQLYCSIHGRDVQRVKVRVR